MGTIRLGADHIALISTEAVAALPNECCGLLVGVGDPLGGITVTEVVTSPNLAAADGPDRFEVDPAVRFETMRRLENTGKAIVGHYHSHPNHPPEPSATDLSMAFEPELAWLICGLERGRVTALRAYRLLADGSAFEPLGAVPGADNRFALPQQR